MEKKSPKCVLNLYFFKNKLNEEVYQEIVMQLPTVIKEDKKNSCFRIMDDMHDMQLTQQRKIFLRDVFANTYSNKLMDSRFTNLV